MTDPAEADRRRAVSDLEAAFSQLMTEFRRLYTQMAQEASPGMLPATIKTLAFISRFGPITQSALAERIPADKSLVSRQVSELESLGFVARTTDPTDARVRHIEVTDAGRERLAAARGPYERMLNEALADWSLSDVHRLTSLLHSLAKGFTPAAQEDEAGEAGDSTP